MPVRWQVCGDGPGRALTAARGGLKDTAMRRTTWMLMLCLCASRAHATPLAPYLVRPASWLVENVSGLPLDRPVPVTQFTPEEARQYLSADLERDLKGQDLEAQSQLLFAFGFTSTPVDIQRVFVNLVSSQAAAFYDPRTGRFHTIARLGALDLLGEPVVVAHELTHAAQDQARGVVSVMDARKEDDDLTRAFQWILEGEATVVGNRAGSMLGPPLPGPPGKLLGEALTWISWTPQYGAAAAMGTQLTTTGDPPPPFFTDQLLAPYLAGSRAFWTVEAQLGKRAHAFMVCRPAQSTEELLHPAKYLSGNDPPIRVELPPPPNARVRAQLTHGEWALQWLLRQTLPQDVADQAAAGWGGDRMAMASDGAMVWRVIMDSPLDAAQLAAAFQASLPQRQALHVELAGDEVHVFNDAGRAWAAGFSHAARGRHAADPAPRNTSLCARP